MSDLIDVNPIDEMVEALTKEVTSIKRRRSEIKDQIDSMTSQVDREQNRYTGIAMELRSMKENLDTTPREDIRDKYDEALDVRFRLATMRGQLEKFEANYEYLGRQEGQFQEILNTVRGVESFDTDGGEAASGGGEFDIVGLIRTQEEERERLARLMHDGPAQALTNFILQAEICQRLFDRNPERAAEELDNLKSKASSTFQKVRDYIFDLRPMMLGDLGVAPTVRRYVESYKEKNEIEVTLDVFGDERRLETYREVMIFRGLQDGMSMARDYANPSTINVSLDMSSPTWRVSIEDDGKGFDAENIFTSTEDEGYSDARVEQLKMLSSRWKMLGGTIDVSSDETSGTRVRMELPSGL